MLPELIGDFDAPRITEKRPLAHTLRFERQPFEWRQNARCSNTTEQHVRFNHNNQEKTVMRSTHPMLLATFWSTWVLAGCATAEPTATTLPALARITVLYDAFGKDTAMTKDWGYAALVEINGKRILFDTGDDPGILAKNVRAKGVDLTRLDFVVLSHRHSDHVGTLLSAKREPEG